MIAILMRNGINCNTQQNNAEHLETQPYNTQQKDISIIILSKP
jgi:hypothetical protein